MKCVLYFFTLCSIGRFIDGQGIKEDRNDKFHSEDSIYDGSIKANIEERLSAHEDDGGAMFRGETEENVSGDKKAKTQDATLEANTEGSEQGEPILLSRRESPSDDTNDSSNQKRKKLSQDTIKRFESEMVAGDPADLVGQNKHIEQEYLYKDLGRRFVPQYEYTGAFKKIAAEQDEDLIPEKAPPELVLVVAKESALLGPDKDIDPGIDVDRKKILRSGDYWNGVVKEEVKWKEDTDVKSALRSATPNKALIEPMRYEVAPEYRFLHYPSITYYAKSRMYGVNISKPLRTSRKPIRRKL